MTLPLRPLPIADAPPPYPTEALDAALAIADAPFPTVEPAGADALSGAEAYAALAAVYDEVNRRVAALAPQCNVRGICCDFDRVDHVLYASRLEVDFAKDHLDPAAWGRDAGNVCPLLVEGRCTAREHRFLGCRTYFCQDGWDALGDAIYAQAYEAIKAIARREARPWAYRPVLEQLRERGGTSE